MEALFSSRPLVELKTFCKRLNIKQHTSKDPLIRGLLRFLATPGGRRSAEGAIPYDILKAYDRLIEQRSHQVPDQSLLHCICISERGAAIMCTKCEKYQHVSCMGANASTVPYFCPRCIMMKLNPLDCPIEMVLPPWRLREYNGNQLQTRFMVLNSELMEYVHSGRGGYQIQMRCIRLDGKTQYMTWPSKGYLTVNWKIAMRFEVSDNPNAKKRKDEQLNITKIVNVGKNPIGVYFLNETQTYAAAVFLVYMKTEELLIREIKSNDTMSVENSKEFILKTLRAGDEEIQSDSIKFSLKCPISMCFLETPVRGINCKHIQCFNLEQYINLQRTFKVNRWKCPICKEFVYDMVVDLFIAQIVEKAKQSEQAYGVEIFSNADYKILNTEEFVERNQASDDSLPTNRSLGSESLPSVRVQRVADVIELD